MDKTVREEKLGGWRKVEGTRAKTVRCGERRHIMTSIRIKLH